MLNLGDVKSVAAGFFFFLQGGVLLSKITLDFNERSVVWGGCFLKLFV